MHGSIVVEPSLLDTKDAFSSLSFARAALVITGTGTQGVGFEHVPDWNLYKNDDWGKRREVLRRLVNAVGRWIVRKRADRRLAAIRVGCVREDWLVALRWLA